MKCERCGTEKISYPGTFAGEKAKVLCPLDEKDCRIAALESELAATRKALDESDRHFLKAVPFLPAIQKWSEEERAHLQAVDTRQSARAKGQAGEIG